LAGWVGGAVAGVVLVTVVLAGGVVVGLGVPVSEVVGGVDAGVVDVGMVDVGETVGDVVAPVVVDGALVSDAEVFVHDAAIDAAVIPPIAIPARLRNSLRVTSCCFCFSLSAISLLHFPCSLNHTQFNFICAFTL